jgi:hypothetical protein
VAQAAALALALARAEGFDEELAAARERLTGEEERARLDRVRAVLDGGDLATLREDFTVLAGDRLVRERWFGR